MSPLQECQALIDLAKLAQEQSEPGLFISPELLEALVRRAAAGLVAMEMTTVITRTGSARLTGNRIILDLAGIQGIYDDICSGELDPWAGQSPSSLEDVTRTLASTTSPIGSSATPALGDSDS